MVAAKRRITRLDHPTDFQLKPLFKLSLSVLLYASTTTSTDSTQTTFCSPERERLVPIDPLQGGLSSTLPINVGVISTTLSLSDSLDKSCSQVQSKTQRVSIEPNSLQNFQSSTPSYLPNLATLICPRTSIIKNEGKLGSGR